MFSLSNDKDTQEYRVAEQFCEHLIHSGQLSADAEIVKLPEADHDFIIKNIPNDITLQITEIVEREFTTELSMEKYKSGAHTSYIVKEGNPIPWAVDEMKRDNSLRLAIERKLLRNYTKGNDEILWLLIFTTSSCIQTEISTTLKLAGDYLYNIDHLIFDKIWFTNLLTKPTQIWPVMESN